MRFYYYLKFSLLSCLAILPFTVHSLETKISGEMWGRWTMEQTKQLNNDSKYENKWSKNYMSLERGYLGLETAFNANTKGRFTVDIFSSDATHQIIDKTTDSDHNLPVDSISYSYKNSSIDGAGLKIKYAYVDFANLFPVPEMNLTVGCQKVYFGTIYDWNYNLIEKAPTDLYKIANSSDYGVTLNGFLPNGVGEYAVGVYNGEGYKKVGASLSDNTELAYLGNLRMTPISGITIGGSYMHNSVGRKKALSGDAANAAYEQDNLVDGLIRLNYGPVDFWGEYISKDMKFPNVSNGSKDWKSKGYMLFPTISLKQLAASFEKSMSDIQLLVRFDSWDESDNPTASKQWKLNTTTLGVNYNFLHDAANVPAMQLQLDYSMKKYDSDKSAPAYDKKAQDSSSILLQLKWRFSSTITN